MATIEERLKPRKRYQLMPLVVVILMQVMVSNVEAERVSGDFDGNGVVDFSDFLVFAGNFGKTGDPYDPNAVFQTTTYDTVRVYVQELFPPANDLEIPDLSSIYIYALSKNWDADPENDGFVIYIQPQDRYINNIANWIPPKYPTEISLIVEVRIYSVKSLGDNPDPEIAPIYSRV